MDRTENSGKSTFWRRFILNIAIILAITAIVLVTSVCAAGATLVSSETFPEGTVISGVDLSGLTLTAGREALELSFGKKLDAMSVELDYDGETITLAAADLGLGYDIDSAIAAVSYGTEGAGLREYVSVILTPRPRENNAVSLAYDSGGVAEVLERALSPYDIAPENAKLLFNEEEGSFSYEPEVLGRKAKVELAAESVISLFETEASPRLTVSYDTVEPEITRAKLEENTSLIGECAVPLPDNANASDNLRLACQQLDGTVIMPDEIFSLCGSLSAPTAEAGYKPAPQACESDVHGELSGGICRLSGALYNAALLTNMEIVSRTGHTYVPDYFPAGLDALIDWESKDLKIKNSSEHPIYISAKISGDSLTLRLFGQSLSEGMTIKAATERIREIEPAEPGGNSGFEVAVYRNYYINDSLKSSEIVSRDVYEAKPVEVSGETGTGVK